MPPTRPHTTPCLQARSLPAIDTHRQREGGSDLWGAGRSHWRCAARVMSGRTLPDATLAGIAGYGRRMPLSLRLPARWSQGGLAPAPSVLAGRRRDDGCRLASEYLAVPRSTTQYYAAPHSIAQYRAVSRSLAQYRRRVLVWLFGEPAAQVSPWTQPPMNHQPPPYTARRPVWDAGPPAQASPTAT